MKLPTVGLLHVRDRRLLLAFSCRKQCFYLPGGKIDGGETPQKALCREIAEELNLAITEDELRYHTHVSAPAYGEAEGTVMEQDCFFLHCSIDPQPSGEVGEVKYFSLQEYLSQMNRAPGAIKIMEQLRMEGYID